MNNNIFTKELDDNTLLIDSTNNFDSIKELDDNTLLIDSTNNLNYIKLLEKYESIKLNEKNLIQTNLKLKNTINNLRNINYNTHIKNHILNKKLNNYISTIQNLELDIIQMNEELDEYHSIVKTNFLENSFNQKDFKKDYEVALAP